LLEFLTKEYADENRPNHDEAIGEAGGSGQPKVTAYISEA